MLCVFEDCSYDCRWVAITRCVIRPMSIRERSQTAWGSQPCCPVETFDYGIDGIRWESIGFRIIGKFPVLQSAYAGAHSPGPDRPIAITVHGINVVLRKAIRLCIGASSK